MNTEWITKEQAERNCKAIVSVIPGSKMLKYATSRQVRSNSGKIIVIYWKASAEDIRSNPSVDGMFRKA